MTDLAPRLSFSLQNKDLQVAWDSTSMGALKHCPRFYQLSIVLGYVPRDESVHLTFGLRYHEALEAYDHAKASGNDHEHAVRHAVRTALQNSWNSALKRPWFSDHKLKNRETLIRSVIWYLEQFKDDPIKTLILANGKPAVELSFRLDLGRKTRAGESLLLCGHLDRMGEFNGAMWIADRKTTAYTIGEDFFSKFTPDNQMSTYAYAGKIVFETENKGIIIDGAQIAINFTRFQRGFAPRTDAQLDEWRQDLDHYITLAEYYAKEGYWPMNDKACGMYGGCQYRNICKYPPGNSRADWLKAGYTRRSWDPLKVRGDI
jgi:hypothetical protein